jgi:hypothetical protein
MSKVSATTSGSTSASRRSSRDPLRHGGPDAGQGGERLGVLLLDGHGYLADRADHRPERLLHAHPVHRAEQLEKLPLRLGQKTYKPRCQPALHRIAFEIFNRVQADLLPDLLLQLPPGELGNQHLVLEGPDLQRGNVVLQGGQWAGDFGDQFGGSLLP